MPQVENNGVKYDLEPRQDKLYGFGVDVYMLDKEGGRPKEPIAFVAGQDEAVAASATEKWLKIAFPLEAPGKKPAPKKAPPKPKEE